MRRLSSLFAAVSLALGSTMASAVVLTLDDFQPPNSTDTTITDFTAGDGFVTDGGGLNPYSRATFVDMTLGPVTAVSGGPASKVTIGSATFPGGLLSVSNDDGVNSIVTVAWSLPAGYFTAGLNSPPTGAFGTVVSAGTPVAFVFDMVRNDVPVTVKIFDSTTAQIASFVIGLGGAGTYTSAPLTVSQFNAINAGGAFTLQFSGAPSWDAAVDRFGFDIPEPATLALAGLALVGAGVASRRRKA